MPSHAFLLKAGQDKVEIMQNKRISSQLNRFGYAVTRKELSKDNPHRFDILRSVLIKICDDFFINSDVIKNDSLSSKFYKSFFTALLDVNELNGKDIESMLLKMSFKEVDKAVQRHNRKIFGKRINYENSIVLGGVVSSRFYNSSEWRTLRYAALEKYGNSCFACGSSPKSGKIIHVDHIKPRSIYPEHALNINNLQILCEDCNLGKSNKFEKDWR